MKKAITIITLLITITIITTVPLAYTAINHTEYTIKGEAQETDTTQTSEFEDQAEFLEAAALYLQGCELIEQEQDFMINHCEIHVDNFFTQTVLKPS